MSIKLVALDLDGTLLDSNKNMPADFVPWVKNHPEIKTILASGRQYFTILRDFPDARDKMIVIAENGGLIYEKGEIIYTDTMEKSAVHRALDAALAIPGTTPLVCGVKSAYVPFVDDYTYSQTAVFYEQSTFTNDLHSHVEDDDILKVAIYFGPNKAEDYIDCFSDLGEGVTAVLSGEYWIDIANTGVDKGAAVKYLQRRLNILPSESAAFGDYLNDLSMLRACDESYCMENGHPELKKYAAHIADSNDDDGVMKILRNY